jgi:hypothetical protein
MRSFDPRSVGAFECRAWETYRWVEAGCDPDDALLAEERALLIRSYAALLAAVYR